MEIESARKLVEVAPAVHAMFMASKAGRKSPRAHPHHFHGMLPGTSMDHVHLASAAVTDRHIAKSCTPNSGEMTC
ncbi:hypothetical protein CQ13_26105 [Bradyrhizobium retamae]|uniref:Uncharacterized protein n=1 Tax=Bradyrhizobium retamae TaxID=1300035 RepID=A0A0R3MW20_9BRAD|nr:hypothetical protein CQ13_26105 [Bradyrhizobium retamae]